MLDNKRFYLQLLNKEDIEKIHEASLYLLTEVGIKVDDSILISMLKDLGCKESGELIKINNVFIEKVLSNVKNRDELCFESRTGRKVILKRGQVLSHPFGAVPHIIDLDSGKKREATLEDQVNTILLMNKLDQIDMPGPMLYTSDVPPYINQYKMVEYILRYSEKPVLGPGISSPIEAKYIIELIKVFADAFALPMNKVMSLAVSPESPLYFPQKITDTIKIITSAGIPTIMLPCPTSGLTAPLTLAGGLAQMNAVMLAFAVIAYLINPQTPLIYGARLNFANMKNCHVTLGMPEMGLSGACSAQLAAFYGFPSDVYGLSSTSCTFDSQSGYEKAINGMLPVLAGANLVSGLGSVASATVASYEQLVIDNEIFSILRKVAKGFVVNEDTLALDIITDATLEKGNYLQQEHTVRHLRGGEIFIPKLGFDALWDDWESIGERDIRMRAQEYARNVISESDAIPLANEIEKEIEKITESALKELESKN